MDGLYTAIDRCGGRWMAQVIDQEGMVVAEQPYSSAETASSWAASLLQDVREQRTRQLSLLPNTWVRAQARKR